MILYHVFPCKLFTCEAQNGCIHCDTTNLDSRPVLLMHRTEYNMYTIYIYTKHLCYKRFTFLELFQIFQFRKNHPTYRRLAFVFYIIIKFDVYIHLYTYINLQLAAVAGFDVFKFTLSVYLVILIFLYKFIIETYWYSDSPEVFYIEMQ